MSTAFPLLDLPVKVLQNVLSSMDIVQIVGVSLLSTRAKEIVKALNIKITRIFMTFFDAYIRVSILYSDDFSQWTWNFYPDQYDHEADDDENVTQVDETVASFMPGKVEACIDFTDRAEKFVAFRNPGLSIRLWLTHFHYIFSYPTVEDLFFVGARRTYDTKAIKETVEGFNLKNLVFRNDCSVGAAELAIRNIPFTASVFLGSSQFNDVSKFRNVFMQNLDVLVVGCDGSPLKVRLDDLLLMNSKEIDIESPIITDKVINRFLKFWIRGSNPRMKHVKFTFREGRVFDAEVILSGLNYQEIPFDHVRYFKVSTIEGGECDLELNAGCDIRRKDGTVGTINIHQSDEGHDFHFCVWH